MSPVITIRGGQVEPDNTAYLALRCIYHPEREQDADASDTLGEYVLHRPMPLCAECAEYFENEPFDHKDWT